MFQSPRVLSPSKTRTTSSSEFAQAQSIFADDYALATVRTEQTANGKTEKKVLVDRFDPAKSGDARWTLVSVDNATPSADDLNRFRKEST